MFEGLPADSARLGALSSGHRGPRLRSLIPPLRTSWALRDHTASDALGRRGRSLTVAARIVVRGRASGVRPRMCAVDGQPLPRDLATQHSALGTRHSELVALT